MLGLNLLIASRPSTREEPSPHIISRPTNTAVRATLRLATATRGPVNLQIKLTSRTSNTREHRTARTPQDSMRRASREGRPLRNARGSSGDVPGNVREQRLHVAGHVGVVLVVFLRVRGFGQDARFLFVAGG